jgi:hypothetical protein
MNIINETGKQVNELIEQIFQLTHSVLREVFYRNTLKFKIIFKGFKYVYFKNINFEFQKF